MDASSSEEYRKAWTALMALVDQGGSFSGHERNCAFLNIAGKRFANASAAAGFDLTDDARSIGLVDWNFDGKVDLWIANRTAPRLRLLINNGPAKNHFLAVHLRGKICNRDAIGARVELHLEGEPPLKLLRTLHAGNGFLSQSSKWLFFGLGPRQAIQKLVVRWPGCRMEEFQGLRADQHYLITQGDPRVEVSAAPAAAARLKPAELPPPEASEPRRIPLTLRMPMPSLRFRDFDGKPASRLFPAPRPLLVNFWASWCGACSKELKEFADQESLLRAGGIEILALSADGLSGDRSSAPAASQNFIRGLKFPFSGGFATPELMESLEILYSTILHDQRPFPVPMSFLVDSSGWITAVYRGTVTAEQLLSDARLCAALPLESAQKSLPFPGRWHELPLQPTVAGGNLGWVATAFELAGFKDEALLYWKGYLSYSDKVPRPAGAKEGAQWDQELARILSQETARILHQAGRTEEAIAALRQALRLKPDLSPARFNLASLLERMNHAGAALAEFRALFQDPLAGLAAMTRAAMLLAASPDPGIRNGEEAVQIAQRACQLSGYRDPESLDALAAAYAESGRFDEALITVQKALGLAASANPAALAGQIEERRRLYQSRQPFRMPAGSR
ncbi:MAG: ASPIC/UnbV domain-containing protein [Planctomycetes bacterium]|nr:ASPIC/UnbV domain-containing protein [Planctomycetota bacterium]